MIVLKELIVLNIFCNHRSQAEMDSTYCSREKQGVQGHWYYVQS